MHKEDDAERSRPRIYLAGPSVFDADPVARGNELRTLCADHGAVGLYPMDNDLGEAEDIPSAIRDANISLILSCDAIVADMTPFRGPSMDPGTAYEMGAGSVLGKLVVGYTSDLRPYVERVSDFVASLGGTVETRVDGTAWDDQGMQIESFGMPLVDNLMMARGIDALFSSAEEAIAYATRLLLERMPLPERSGPHL